MLYFSVILCIRQCFISVTVYTIRGTNIPHVSLHYMFQPDGAIFRYIGVLQSPVFLLLFSPHWPVFIHWECVVYMFFICPVLRNVLLVGYLNIKILFVDVKTGVKIKISKILNY
jgi:hypothetical protein